MKLSQAVGIMQRMKQDNHIDPDIFDVFVQSGVYRQYGEQFLAADQLDAVNLSP
jgi:HD-GYP domain-containing protein (c-di-GMP phosphodiesterase class II)